MLRMVCPSARFGVKLRLWNLPSLKWGDRSRRSRTPFPGPRPNCACRKNSTASTANPNRKTSAAIVIGSSHSMRRRSRDSVHRWIGRIRDQHPLQLMPRRGNRIHDGLVTRIGCTFKTVVFIDKEIVGTQLEGVPMTGKAVILQIEIGGISFGL